jgi:hypothetical protein
MPECKNKLVHDSGTLLGKIAHICGAKPMAARYEKTQTEQDRHHLDNLILVCGPCHDIIDDPDNAAEYHAPKLRKFKKRHEARFKKAERLIIEQLDDTTQAHQPTYPKTLRRLASAIGIPELANTPDEIEGVAEFIDRLKEVPYRERFFALKLAERMQRQRVDRLPVEDVMGAFNIGTTKLNELMRVLEHHYLGRIDEARAYGQYEVTLQDRKPAGNPFIEILDFCRYANEPIEALVEELNFSLYD